MVFVIKNINKRVCFFCGSKEIIYYCGKCYKSYCRNCIYKCEC